MNAKTKIADSILKISLFSAKKSCGAASMFGFYQPKEPKALSDFAKKMQKS